MARSRCLTDSGQLRWIKQNRAVDVSKASASARSIGPLPAASLLGSRSFLHAGSHWGEETVWCMLALQFDFNSRASG